MTKAKNPVSYTAPEDVYVDNTYHKAGDPFTTTAEPNDNWVKLTTEEAHTIEASVEKVPGDPPLEGLGIEALRAVAVTKKVNPDGMNKKELITAIKAANEPAL